MSLLTNRNSLWYYTATHCLTIIWLRWFEKKEVNNNKIIPKFMKMFVVQMIFEWKLKYSVNITYLYWTGSYYGNSYNKAGYCPSSGRRRRDAESGPEIADARYNLNLYPPCIYNDFSYFTQLINLSKSLFSIFSQILFEWQLLLWKLINILL